jgi:branched-chain amino acid transport system substrate-binding protein
MKGKTWLTVAAAAAWIVLIQANCTRSPVDAVADPVKIGVVGPFTGEGATYGEAMKRGVDLALKEANRSTMPPAKQFVALYEDDKLSSKDGISAFRKLVDVDRVQAIIGSAGSSVSLALAPLAAESKVVLFSPISTADSLRDAGEFFFRDIPPNRNQAKTAAFFIRQYLKKSKVAVFYENNDYGNNMKTIIAQHLAPLGGQVVIGLAYESGQRDFKDALAKIRAARPEVVFVPGTYQENGLIVAQGRKMGLDLPFIGGDGAYSPQFINLAGKAAEGFYLTMIALPAENSDPDVGRFYANFRAAYNAEPDIYSALSYDAATIIIKAVCTVGNDGIKIADALHSTEYSGVTGRIKFDSHGEVDKPYKILVVKDKRFLLLDWEPVF